MGRVTNAMKRFFSSLDAMVLSALAGAIAWLLLSGNTTAFLHPRFRLFLLVGVLMLTAFIFVMIRGPKSHHHNWLLADHTLQALVLAMPVLFLMLSMHQNMGTQALTRKYTGNEQETLARLLKSGEDKPLADNGSLTLLQIARQMKQLEGKRVVTEGLVYRPEIMPPGHLTLFRFAIFCCAADALPVWLFVQNPAVTDFNDENWVCVEGTLTIVNFNGTDVPVIRADSIKKKPAPSTAEQYLFF